MTKILLIIITHLIIINELKRKQRKRTKQNENNEKERKKRNKCETVKGHKWDEKKA